MSSYNLKIVAPDSLAFDGDAERLIARAIDGDVCILARHENYMTCLGKGEVKVREADGTLRRALCGGGTLIVRDGKVKLITESFEWENK